MRRDGLGRPAITHGHSRPAPEALMTEDVGQDEQVSVANGAVVNGAVVRDRTGRPKLRPSPGGRHAQPTVATWERHYQLAVVGSDLLATGIALTIADHNARPWVFLVMPTIALLAMPFRYLLRRYLHRARREGRCLLPVVAA